VHTDTTSPFYPPLNDSPKETPSSPTTKASTSMAISLHLALCESIDRGVKLIHSSFILT